MKAFASLKGELNAILHNRKMLIAIIGVMTIPLLYSGMYLWAFWNPYAHIDRMPVAIVNQDQGAVYDGKTLKIGDDLVKNLKRKKTFNWEFVTEEQADKGLENQDYYIKIEIPKDFSANATTLQSEHPKKLNLIYTPNEGSNYLSTKIGDSALEKIKEEVASSVTETYAESMFKNIKDIANGLDKASSGAADLYQGIGQAKDGAVSLNVGINAANSGAEKVASGAQSVDAGAKQLEQNLEQLAKKSVAFSQGVVSASSGSKQLASGLQQFQSGLGQLKEGNAQLLAGAQKSAAGTKQFSQGLDAAAAKLPDLAKGSKQLADGTSALSASLEEWQGGAEQTKGGADSVSQGLQQLVGQVSKMAEATADPAEKAQLEALLDSLTKLSAGSQSVAGGIGSLAGNAGLLKQASDTLTAGAGQLNDGQNQFADGINQLAGGAKQLAGGQDQLIQGLSTFGDKLDEAVKGFNKLAAGSTSLSNGLEPLASGSAQFQVGTNQLAQGSEQLAAGTAQLSKGGSALKDGMSNLSNGASELTAGMNKLADGSKELSNQLHSGAKDASHVKANQQVYQMFAKPVNLKDNRINKVPNYGTGFTPYFLSLSLFVGALMLSIIFPMFQPAVQPKSGFGWFTGKLGILLAVGIGQALLADAILLLGLGLEVKSLSYFLMLSILISWTFLAIIQFLVVTLDNPGRFLAVILLTLQLTSSGGTYPIELVPSFLRNIMHFLPMTYAVAGFRAVISTGNYSFMWNNIGHILIFLAAFLAGTLTFFTIKFKRHDRSQLVPDTTAEIGA